MNKSELVIAIDNREKRPYRFPRSELKMLESGDYSIVGCENQIAIERKSHSDAYASLGRSRPRFEREMQRLSRLDYSAIIVEASLSDFLKPPAFSRMPPKTAVSTLLAWAVKYRVPVFFAGDRRHGRALTRCLLEKYWHYYGAKDGQKEAS